MLLGSYALCIDILPYFRTFQTINSRIELFLADDGHFFQFERFLASKIIFSSVIFFLQLKIA